VILGGGSGTRLWPASRQILPKHLLPIAADGGTLLGAAVRRGAAISDRVTIVTAESQRAATAAVAPTARIIGEPVARNTAAALGLAAATIEREDPDAVMMVLPADQHVANEAGFVNILDSALGIVDDRDTIVTIGIQPTRAETGFGYLELDPIRPATGVLRVTRFVEKPDQATATQYVASRRFLWNAGIFFVRAKRLMAELAAHLPQTAAAVRDIAAGKVAAAEVYPTLRSISIDHAVMEHVTGIEALAANVGWDDVGSWAAMPALRGADANGNTTVGPVVAVESTGNILMSDDDTVIAVHGITDLVVVKSGNAILVIRKDASQDVRKVVDALSANGLARYL
jgi:mannose-1-phosphate guanylyltransferase